MMRRQDKLCTDEQFYNLVFSTAEEIYVAFMDGDFPYCLPFNFVKQDNHILIHCALEGLKLECIKLNPNVAFALACDIMVDRQKSTTWYKSVCGRGKASIISDEKEKQDALDLIAIRYGASCKRPSPPAMTNRVKIIKLEIISLTGKNSRPKS